MFATCGRTTDYLCAGVNDMSEIMRVDHEQALRLSAMLSLQIVSVAKWHGSQVAELAQGIGKHVWVQFKDLASSSQAITLAQVGILQS